MIKTLKGNKQQFKIPMPEGKKCIQKDNSSGVDCLLFTEKRMHAIENIWENGEKQEVEEYVLPLKSDNEIKGRQVHILLNQTWWLN